MITDDRILVLDYGSQYTQLIARNLREIGVYSEIWPWDFDRDANNVIDKKVAQLLIDFKPKAIILSGGPESVANNEAPKIPEYIFDLNIPILGVCYGLQALSAHFGGVVETSNMREYGHAEVVVKSSIDVKAHPFIPSDLVDNKFSVWMSHSDKVTKIPDCFDLLASTKNAENVIIAHKEKPIYGIQFHPEVTHTEFGKELLSNFALNIAGCKNEWRSDNIAQMEVDKIREQVGTDHVILGLSGGVDSSVAAVLLHKAIGDQLTCIFVDHGLLRFQEGDDVMNTFSEHLGVKVIRVNAKERFMSQLKGVSDPEAKRKIIGNEFVKVFEEESKKIDNAKWLAQGTIYPDVIESAGAKTGKAKVIKSHHNVGGLPEDMELKLVEPLRMLFKDEVRKIGVELGLAKSMVYRHPFPGPGLGVRILGEVKAEYAEILQKADAIFIEELRAHDLYDKVSQAFAVFLPVKSVGVVGDNRAYEYVVALRSVETIDFMTARWSRLPYDFLDLVSSRIINEISGISRVVYDISGKPPATIEWE